MIPKYPYRVEVISRLGGQQVMKTKNYETLPAAVGYRCIMLGKPSVRSVRILLVLEEVSNVDRSDLGLRQPT